MKQPDPQPGEDRLEPSLSISAVADRAWMRSDPSTSGQTTKLRCPARDLGPHPLPDLGVVGVGARPASSRPVSAPTGARRAAVMSRSPKTTIAAVRGIGVAVITSTSGIGARSRRRVTALRSQRRALLDPEPVLLVDHRDTERREPDVVGEKSVGADDEVDRTVGEPLARPGALGARRCGS